jgi:hypothetical protein
MISMSMGLVRLVTPRPGDGNLDFYERRARYGLPLVLGLMIYALAQLLAD